MKKLVLSFVTVAVLALNVGAADYKEVMEAAIQKMYQAKTAEELNGLANQFARISEAEKNEWLPGYYAAYCYVTIVSQMNPEKTVAAKYLDMAQENIGRIQQRAKDESDIYALQALIYQLRITDMNDGMKYSPMASEALAVAESLNSENPRVYYLRGTNTFYTPEMYGGGAGKAKPLFEKAMALFATAKPKELYPSWGKEHAAIMLEQCKTAGQ